jgi:glutamine amidotransferase
MAGGGSTDTYNEAKLRVAVIDAGGANLGSVCYALERFGVAAFIAHDPDDLLGADRVILPGVGAAAPAMTLLRDRGFDSALRASQAPLLGICLGMQLLFESSEEGDVECLGLLHGHVRRMQPAVGVRVPHMGWNTLCDLSQSASFLDGIKEGDHAYFVHGYAAPMTQDCIATCRHGEQFAAIVQRGMIHGAQFHPERSAAAGARLMANFLSG